MDLHSTAANFLRSCQGPPQGTEEGDETEAIIVAIGALFPEGS